jgi:hypothetical protein
MLDTLRRRIALAIYPEFTALPYEPGATPDRRPLSADAARCAEELRRLNRMFAARTGTVFDRRSAPAYTGPLYEWRIAPSLVRERVVDTLARLRGDRVMGVQRVTHFVSLNYFAAIWPADLAWPADIPRPSRKTEAA